MIVTDFDGRMALRALANGKAPPALHDELFVGRGKLLELFDVDLDLIEAGGGSVRILVGEPGSGKTMLMQAMAARARGRGFVTASVDLDPDCLLHGRSGEGRSLLRKAVLAMRTAAGGDATSIVSRFGNDCRAEAESTSQLLRHYIRGKLTELHKQPKGAEFGAVIETFALAPENSSLAANARRWLCGDYATLADARDEVGITSIVEDQDFWPMEKLWGSFVGLAGRPGYVLFIDEARVISDLHNPNARALNLEQLLIIFNDILQGGARGIGVIIAVTPSFVTQWNGLAKHEGLSSCLLHQLEQTHLGADLDSVLVRLHDLGDGELVELLRRCRHLYASCHPAAPVVADEVIETFLQSCRNQIGEARWHVPRIVLQRFVAFQDRLAERPKSDWREILAGEAGNSANSESEFEGYAHRQM